ncbi:MAG: glycosyltransferase [Flavobacteriales bacterium]|nr:glycosyltransferase [Flavobacteriales bacterium]
MKLSVIIVNYNVKAYLEQCLRTVFEALNGMEGEVFVVDNLSTDGSAEMVREKYPSVRLIANRENVGFSRANNQAIRESTAEYVVLLNPDTVVGEDVFHKVVDFLAAHPKAGGLGVKMIDGTGRFLPESKRGLPTPTVAFFKIMGLSRLFPHSRFFGRYHLGHLPEDEAAPIEILSGACMFLRKKTLDEVGLLDESFFMYGEDIDLSYRITMGGYENWYLPAAKIIHYKGESTKKSSVNYVFVFYNAMAIFARKHFTRRGPQLFSLVIRGAIYLSAATAIVTRFLREALLPLVDLSLLIGGMFLMERTGVVSSVAYWDKVLVAMGVVGVMALFGAYDRPLRLLNVLKGLAALVIVALAVRYWTGAGPERALPFLAMAGTIFLCIRGLLNLLGLRRRSSTWVERARVLVAGSVVEARLALGLLWQTHYGLGREMTMDTDTANASGGVETLRKLIRRQRLDEVVFCAKDLRMQRIIEIMEELRTTRAVFKIAQPSSEFIIGPSSTESLQDLLILRDHAVNSSASRRRRRTMDVLLSVFFLLSLPISILFVRNKSGFPRNLFMVLVGKLTWVGYASPRPDPRIPRISPGVLGISGGDGLKADRRTVQRKDLEYAKDYRVWKDLGRVAMDFARLGRA